jgi:glutamyl-Q tRNA(Asp) synthetase
LIVEENNGKLAKSRRSLGIDPARATEQLRTALTLLQHPPPPELQQSSPMQLLAWATRYWNLDTVQGRKEILISAQMLQV